MIVAYRLLGLLTVVSAPLSSGCSTLLPEPEPEPIFRPVDLPAGATACQSVVLALQSGGTRLQEIADHLTKSNDWPDATQALTEILDDSSTRFRPHHLTRVAELTYSGPLHVAPDVFRALIDLNTTASVDQGWQIAERRPSPAMAEAISTQLARQLRNSERMPVVGAGVAEALATNKIEDAYPLLRHGFLASKERVYARAMMEVSPKRAAEDLLNYLARADLPALRADDSDAIDDETVILILAHLETHPPSVHNPDFNKLFLYAAATDPRVAKAGQAVIAHYLPEHARLLAFYLTQMPADHQLRFIRSAGRADESPAPLLDAIRRETRHPSVRAELEAIVP